MNNEMAAFWHFLNRKEYGACMTHLDGLRLGPTRDALEGEVWLAKANDPWSPPRELENFSRSVMRCLVRSYLTGARQDMSPQDYRRLLQSLGEASAKSGQDLAATLDGSILRENRFTGENLIKAFYFEKALHTSSPGEKALARREQLQNEMKPRETASQTDYTIQFLKVFSSYTPLLARSDPSRLGGGYFASFGKYGCVIDPGHHFLDNYFRANRSIDDVRGIIVTHFHDDHYADLPALLSLLYQRRKSQKKNGDATNAVDIFLDAQTFKVFEPLLRASPLDGRHIVLRPDTDDTIDLTKGVSLKTIPTVHSVLGGDCGVGLFFEIQPTQSRLIITGDTAWNSRMETVYTQLRRTRTVLVPHVSTVCLEEVMGALFGGESGYYQNHLAIRGLSGVIEALQPSTVFLSEIGEELRDSADRLAELVELVYPCTCKVGWRSCFCSLAAQPVDWQCWACPE